MSQEVRIVARLVARPGADDALLAVLQTCVEASRQEAGNIHYDLYRHLENDHVFLFHETWRDRAAVDNHNQQPHFQKLLVDSAPLLVEEPEITLY